MKTNKKFLAALVGALLALLGAAKVYLDTLPDAELVASPQPVPAVVAPVACDAGAP